MKLTKKLSKALKQTKKYPKTLVFAKLLVLFLVFFFMGTAVYDPDFGWHLRTGDYIRQHGVPMHDLYTYTAPSFKWIDHEWGHDVIVSSIYGLWGFTALASVFSLIWAASLIIIGSKARLWILIVAAVTMLPYSGVRAVAWSVLFMAILLRLINSKNEKLKYLSIPLILLWANLHGGFIIGLFILAFTFVKTRKKVWLAIFLLSALATFVNPFGPRLYVEVARTLTDSSLHTQIIEWDYIGFTNETLLFIVLWGAGFWLFGRKKRSDWFSLSGIMLLASASAARNIPLFVLSAVNEVDDYYTQFRKQLPAKLTKSHKLLLGLTALFLIGWFVHSSDNRLINRNYSHDIGYPVQAVQYINNHPCPNNVIFNSYGYGGYLIWKLPNYKVYIDGRMPSWRDEHGEKYLNRQFRIFDDANYRKQQFKEFGIKCVLLSGNVKEVDTIKELKKQKWHQIKQIEDSNLLVAP